MRVLLVEDDVRLAATLRRGLEESGFGVDIVDRGDDVDAAVATTDYDVIVLDVMLPGGEDGFSICRRLRSLRTTARILMLTALETVEDRVRGLDAGADDFMVKPFAFRELCARLRALSRRHLENRTAVFTAGPLHFDTASREVSVGDESVDLTAKETAILEYLMHHPHRLLSRRQLEEHVWNYDTLPNSNLVEVYIARIRQKLARAGLAEAITTVRGGGYRFKLRAAASGTAGSGMIHSARPRP
ncbi:MAG: response regulator transcription factor [Candidatus Dormibacteria bacterium]